MEYKGVIYKVTNTVNGKCYIGQTVNFKQRKRDHIRGSVKSYRHDHNCILHKAFRKYGIDAFMWEIICVVTAEDVVSLKDKLDEAEIKYINEFDSKNSGYNSTDGGGGSLGCIVPDDVRIKHSISMQGKHAGIENPFYGRKHTAESRKLMGKSGVDNPNYGNRMSDENKEKIREANKRSIDQYSVDGTLLKSWNGIIDTAKELGIGKQGISACCRGDVKISAGYVWRYKGDPFDKYSIKHKSWRCIIQMTKSGDFIKEWESVYAACKALKLSSSNIAVCLRPGNEYRSCGGFKWKYKDGVSD